jgi:arylsulfatase A
LDTRLAELGIRDNTLLLFVGDNGTNTGVTSRFADADYKGGKGTTTQRGTHVPLIASWPRVMKTGRVNRDLISSVDFLPTLCEAAGISTPENSDGVSFLPQLRGETGRPRDWLYAWYSPRQKQDLTVREFAFDHHYKLYRNGRFFDLRGDPNEQQPLEVQSLKGAPATSAAKLQKALDQFQNARPAELDRAFSESESSRPTAKRPKDKGAKRQRSTN